MASDDAGGVSENYATDNQAVTGLSYLDFAFEWRSYNLMEKSMRRRTSLYKQQETETYLDRKMSFVELIDQSQEYYNKFSLPKLATQSYKCHLIRLPTNVYVKLSEELSHVQSMCINEMIVRAFKHILQAMIAAVSKPEGNCNLVSFRLFAY
ncbi:protein TSS [Tanacetum coccineum]|uniref:Protein TSS n=1 Tax=Tanacetum coccineum TaxID=301880 RepID=A0ABQ5E0A7_9ASTR